MAGMKQTIIRTGLETLYFSGMHHLMRPLVGGVGCILTLHHVRPPRQEAFQPNHLLEITPAFLEQLLRRLKRSTLDVISLDEMHQRFISGDFKRRFVCITFDDGYKDLMQWAYPLLKKYQLPFVIRAPIATSVISKLVRAEPGLAKPEPALPGPKGGGAATKPLLIARVPGAFDADGLSAELAFVSEVFHKAPIRVSATRAGSADKALSEDLIVKTRDRYGLPEARLSAGKAASRPNSQATLEILPVP